MANKKSGKDFLFSDDCGFINGDDEGGESYRYSDGSGYYHGADGSEGYIYSDGSGYYHGADGSDGYIYSDGSAYYRGADGTDAYKYSDGSGYYRGGDGSDGYKYSDGSGYFTDASGGRTSYDSSDDYEDEDDDDEEDYSPGSSFAEGIGSALGTILGAGMAAAMAEERAKEAQKEAERKERQARNRAWRKKHRMGLVVTTLVCLCLLFGAIGYYELSIRIPVGYDSSDFVGENYQEVKRKLERAGFKYISEESVEDLSIEDIEKDNLVFGIKIGWSESFDEDSKYPSNFLVTIKYHALETLDVPISAKEAKKSDYQTVLKLFEDAGFTKINTVVEYDIITGWITDDGDIESVEINGEKKFAQGDSYRADAEVTITYHTLKKNKPE